MRRIDQIRDRAKELAQSGMYADCLKVFDSHCVQHGIVHEASRSNIAHHIMRLFEGGAKTIEELKAGLDTAAQTHIPACQRLLGIVSKRSPRLTTASSIAIDPSCNLPALYRCASGSAGNHAETGRR